VVVKLGFFALVTLMLVSSYGIEMSTGRPPIKCLQKTVSKSKIEGVTQLNDRICEDCGSQ